MTEAPRTTTTPGDGEGSLTHRAALTFASNLLQQGARLAVGFLVTPLVIHGLGAQLYGAWVMIQQTAGYLALSDLRPMGTLKFSLAVRQHVADFGEKRRQIGAALLLWAATLPILLAVGVVAVWATPRLIRTDPEHVWAVRMAMSITLLSVALDRVVSLPANVLRGTNLDYKAMGLNAATVLLGGGLTALAIWRGWGLPGVAVSSVAGLLLAGGVRFWVAKRVLPWFGASRPMRGELSQFCVLSGWLFLSSVSYLLLNASDLFIVGLVLGPAAAAVYATTGAVLRLAVDPLAQLLSSGSAGLAELCGRRQWDRVEALRSEMHAVAAGAMTIVGVAVLALNRSFLRLWVGPSYYGGDLLNLLLVLVAVVVLLVRVDGVILDCMLEFRARALANLACGVLAVLLGGILTQRLGLPGMGISLLLSWTAMLGLTQLVLSRRSGFALSSHMRASARPILVGAVLFAAAAQMNRSSAAVSWLALGGYAIAAVIAVATMVWLVSFTPRRRGTLLSRVRSSVALRGSLPNASS